MTAAESTSSLTPLNSMSVCLSVCADKGYDVCLKDGVSVNVCDTICECACLIFVCVCEMLVWELIVLLVLLNFSIYF